MADSITDSDEEYLGQEIGVDQQITDALQDQQHRHDQELLGYKHKIRKLKDEHHALKYRVDILETEAVERIQKYKELEKALQKSQEAFKNINRENNAIVNDAIYTLNAHMRKYLDHTLI